MSKTMCIACASITVLVTACGGGSDGGEADAGPPVDGASAYMTLVSSPWTLAGGQEQYLCVRKTITEDLWIDAFRGIDPVGTHHNVVGLQTNGLPDATFPCDAFTIGTRMLYAEGLGADGITLPPGVAVRVHAGEQILLNLHVFNTGEAMLTGTSGIQAHLVDPDQITAEAEVILAGKVTGLAVPPGMSTQRGTCTMQGDVNLFAVFPHMHKLGVHMTTTVEPVTGEAFPLLDTEYSFEDQHYYRLDPIVPLVEGDQVQIDCTYDNTTGQTVLVGESSDEEMCFTGIYRYPRLVGNPVCTF